MERKEIRRIIRFAIRRSECPELLGRGKIKLEFVDNWTTTLGDAEWFPASSKHDGYGVIRFSTQGFKELPKSKKVELIIHEACHIAADFKFPREKGAHSQQWILLMKNCGFETPRAEI